MSDLQPVTPRSEDQEVDEPSRGPNLILIYGLIAAAMLAAIAVAALVVLPFYNRR